MKMLYMLCMLVLLTGCGHKVLTVPSPEEQKTNVEVIILQGSSPVTEKLIAHIVKRTTEFCQEMGNPGVKRVTIYHTEKTQHTNVAYLCIGQGDPQTAEEVHKSKIPVRVTEEVLGKGKEIVYKTYKALVRGL